MLNNNNKSSPKVIKLYFLGCSSVWDCILWVLDKANKKTLWLIMITFQVYITFQLISLLKKKKLGRANGNDNGKGKILKLY